jgi:hypothetical protein
MGRKGNQAYEPNEDDRKRVEAMSSYGIPEEKIALVIINPRTNAPITAKTLRKYYREELDTGMVKADSQVAQSLFRKAVGAPAEWKTLPDGTSVKVREEIKPDTVACIFWTKARMGWRDVTHHEHSGQNGGPITVIFSKNQAKY